MNRRPRRGARRTLAATSDRHSLYQASVQQPELDVRFYARAFRERWGREPRTLREDFCGTALVACTWCRQEPRRRAVGVDLDPKVLAWGAEHNLLPLPEPARRRVELIHGDVLTTRSEPADVLVAANFSFCVFQTESALARYFQAARSNLARRGVLILDVLGGSDTQIEDREEVRRIDRNFSYVWEQRRFDPITHHALFSIHFRFRDGSAWRHAFRYDWRLWTIPELRQLLHGAGFDRVDVYWEGTDHATGTGNGSFRRRRSAPAESCWIACLVAS